MKTINIQNINNKLQADIIYSLNLAPEHLIPQKDLPMDVIICDPDTNNKFYAKLIDVARIHIFDLGSIVTYASNGVSASEFLTEFKSGSNSEYLMLLIYKKIKDGI
ncbi:MAG: hypothetical protein A3F72_03035 [Bacteroidetes bacterium RIFCSPLOWO2_12_FULL_35_15]|nr:MAG: hypothetical protein A3F72_03035 [Bacteroidetes bacterium RIFCSPLOWO2_12_FULL_35_15]